MNTNELLRLEKDMVEAFALARKYNAAYDAIERLSPETMEIIVTELVAKGSAHLFAAAFGELLIGAKGGGR